MSTTQINTVTGPISSEDLGPTLMHEPVLIGFPGWEADTVSRGTPHDDMLAMSRDRIAEIQDCGIAALVDPCPNDLGRDVEFMAEVAAKTGFTVIAATGLYKEHGGAPAYWKFRGGGAKPMAELFIHELTHGIGDTGIKPGIIKVATGFGQITKYERFVLEAAAMASLETGAPITTHTDIGKLGDEQLEILTSHGVPPHRIIIGHSCGTDDHTYHMNLVRGGSYLGFDRFGIENEQTDDKRVAALLKLIEAGATSRVVVSHDSVWCWRGAPLPVENMGVNWEPTHFSRHIAPQLKAGGASEAQIEQLLTENPRRFFAGDPLPPLG